MHTGSRGNVGADVPLTNRPDEAIKLAAFRLQRRSSLQGHSVN